MTNEYEFVESFLVFHQFVGFPQDTEENITIFATITTLVQSIIIYGAGNMLKANSKSHTVAIALSVVGTLSKKKNLRRVREMRTNSSCRINFSGSFCGSLPS